jgi:hypothetical protein
MKVRATSWSGLLTEDHDSIVKPRHCWLMFVRRRDPRATPRPGQDELAKHLRALSECPSGPDSERQKAVSDSNKAGIVTIKIFASSAIDQFCA